MRLSLKGRVEGEELHAVLAGRSPTTREVLRDTRGARVPGFDLTFSAPKSVSVLYGIGAEKTSSSIRRAHDAADMAEPHHDIMRRVAPVGVVEGDPERLVRAIPLQVRMRLIMERAVDIDRDLAVGLPPRDVEPGLGRRPGAGRQADMIPGGLGRRDRRVGGFPGRITGRGA